MRDRRRRRVGAEARLNRRTSSATGDLGVADPERADDGATITFLSENVTVLAGRSRGPRVGLATMRGGRDKRSWRWFAAWMMPGICLALGVSALGVFAVPLGLVLVSALAWRRPTGDALGLLAGLGVIVAWIGSVNFEYRACSTQAVRLTLVPGAPRSASYSCGGVSGLPWLIVGLSTVAVAIILYLLTTRATASGGKSTSPALS
jgi:hypothetical protein